MNDFVRYATSILFIYSQTLSCLYFISTFYVVQNYSVIPFSAKQEDSHTFFAYFETRVRNNPYEVKIVHIESPKVCTYILVFNYKSIIFNAITTWKHKSDFFPPRTKELKTSTALLTLDLKKGRYRHASYFKHFWVHWPKHLRNLEA